MGLLSVGGGDFSENSFSYTGTYNFTDEGDGKWYIDFLTSGILTLNRKVTADIHCVGGGGSGAARVISNYGSGGGGGGYVRTVFAAEVNPGTYTITIGAGGNSVTSTGSTGSNGNDGGTSSFGSICSAEGGKGGKYRTGTTPYS